MKVAVIGQGWVGKSMMSLFTDAYAYTRHLGSKEEVNKSDIAFICIPTPFDGYKLDVSQIDEILSWCHCRLIVIRSTVNPGDCDKWMEKYHKQVLFQPEYLGETPKHPMLDPKTRAFLIIGGLPHHRKQLIDLYTTVYNANITIRQMSLLEAEIVKLTENRAIAFKMMQCQELYDVCSKTGVDYYTIRDAVYSDDPRFNLWFTFVYPDKRGFNNSKCLRKDVPAWAAFAKSVGYDPKLTRALITRSNEYDLYENNKTNSK
jgi:UDP-glucose 6-dehydrogenase